MGISFKQTNIAPGGKGKGSGKSTIIHCHYKSYEGDLKNEVSVIFPTNFGEDCMYLHIYCYRANIFEYPMP